MHPALKNLPGYHRQADGIIQINGSRLALEMMERHGFPLARTTGLHWQVTLISGMAGESNIWEQFSDPVQAAMLYQSLAWLLGATQETGPYNDPCDDLLGYLSMPVALEVENSMVAGRCRGMRRTAPDGRTEVMLWFVPRRGGMGIRRLKAMEPGAKMRTLDGGILIWTGA
jgi:hypothetical protein